MLKLPAVRQTAPSGPQRRGAQLLGGGLAVRAGDADDQAAELGARRARHVAHRAPRIVDGDDRDAVAAGGDAARARHDDAGRARGRGLRREVEAVDALAREREEQLAGRDRAAVVVRAREVRRRASPPGRSRRPSRAPPIPSGAACAAPSSRSPWSSRRHDALPARPPPPRDRRSGAWSCRRSGSPRGPCRRSAARRPARAARGGHANRGAPVDLRVVAARGAAPARRAASFGALVRRTPSRTMSTIAAGSSVRGLSDVTIARSASRAAISPIIGRLPRSRSPPQPNTTISRPRRHRRASPRWRAPARRACARSRRRTARRDRWRPSPAAPGTATSRRAARDRVGGSPRADRHPDRDRQVLEVVVADQRRVDLDPPDRRREGRARAVGVQRAALDDHVRAARAGARATPSRAGAARRARASPAPPRRRRTSPPRRARGSISSLEQDRLGVGVALHVAVIVEVVLRQVGHRRHAEGATRRPAPAPARAKSLLTRRRLRPRARISANSSCSISAPGVVFGAGRAPPGTPGRGTTPSRRRPATGPPRAASPRRYT